MVVGGSKNAQIVRGSDGGSVFRLRVTNGSGVLRDSSFLRVVASLRTNQEAFMAEDAVNVGYGALEDVEESAGVEVRLLEVEVELGTEGLRLGNEICDGFRLHSIGDLIVQLNLCLKDVGGGPHLGQGQACTTVNNQQSCISRGENDQGVEAIGRLRIGDELEQIKISTRWRIGIFRFDLSR